MASHTHTADAVITQASFLFGREGFEGGSLPATFDSQSNWGSGTATLDGTSKVQGTYSLKGGATGEGGQWVEEAADYSEAYFQYKLLIPSDVAFGTATSFQTFALLDSSDNTVAAFSAEDWGSFRFTAWGTTMGWKDIGTTLSTDTEYQIDVYVKVGTTEGRLKVWINQNTEGTPDYDSGNINNGTANIAKVRAGLPYTDGSITNYFYTDDFVVDEEYIGNKYGVSPAIKTHTADFIIQEHVSWKRKANYG